MASIEHIEETDVLFMDSVMAEFAQMQQVKSKIDEDTEEMTVSKTLFSIPPYPTPDLLTRRNCPHRTS